MTQQHQITPPRELINKWRLDNHPITPPKKLVDQWFEASVLEGEITYDEYNFANLAARWGYEQRGAANEKELQKARDEELDACCEWLDDFLWVVQPNHQVHPMVPKGAQLRKHRRPKPQSLKEEALEALKHAEEGWRPVPADCAIIRRALEQLDD